MKRIREWKWLLFVALVVPLLGCAAKTPGYNEEVYTPPMKAVEAEKVVVEREAAAAYDEDGARWAQGETGVPGTTDVTRMIIYNVSLYLIVEDTNEAFAQVRQLTEEMGGFVAGSNIWRDEGHPRGTMTVRVPADKLDDALTQFRELALDVESESIDSQDVTEEYVDLEARLTNEQRTEAELLELLESRSEIGKTADILEVHRELTVVRSRVEQIQGKMTYYENLSAMATVQITLTPDVLMQPIDVGGWRPQGTARNAIRMLLRTLQLFADFAIVLVLYILPVLVVIAIPLAILFFIARAIWRRARRRKRASA